MSTSTTLAKPRKLIAPAINPVQPLDFSDVRKVVQSSWTTPNEILAFALFVLLLSGLFYYVTAGALNANRAAVQSATRDCAPSIVAAQRIRAACADLDANFINALLTEKGSPDYKMAMETIQKRQREIADGLVDASRNITFGEAEHVPILAMAAELGPYQARMAGALAYKESGKTRDALTSMREATAEMHDKILPAADALDNANYYELKKSYGDYRNGFYQALLMVCVCGGALLAFLVVIQRYLTRKMRRIINPGLAGATLIAAVLMANASWRILASSSHLRAAVDDAFESVHFLSKARALALDANADESRGLFDRERVRDWQREFTSTADKIQMLPQATPLPAFLETLRKPQKNYLDFSGLLAEEMGNITYAGERDAAIDCVRTFADYVAIDRRIRDLDNSGKHDQAVALSLSYAPGGSNAAFDAFDSALAATIAINQREFDRRRDLAFATLDKQEWVTAIGILAAAAAALAGLWPRWNEYR